MTRRRWVLALAVVLTLAAGLRLWRLRDLPPGLYADEAMDGNNALEALETGRFQPFYPEDNGREGLYVNVAALSIACFGNQAWALRLPAALFGVLTVAGVALLGAELFGDAVGLLAAFFLATSFWHVLLSREAFRAIAAPCFLTWSLYLLVAARGRPWRMAAAGVVYGLGFYSYIAYRATPLLMALVLRRVGWKRAAIFTGAACLAAAPLAAYFVPHPGMFGGHAERLSVFAGRSAGQAAAELLRNAWRTARMLFTHGDYNWRHNYPWRAELYWPVAACMLIGLAPLPQGPKGPPGSEKPVSSRPLLMIGWLIVGALPAVLSGQDVPHALRSILMLPAAMLLAALGAHRLYEFLAQRAPRRIAAACAAVILALLAYEPYHTYFDLWARDPQMPAAFDGPGTGVARRIRTLPANEDKFVAYPPGADMVPQPVMFLTASYTVRQQATAHIYYLPGGCDEAQKAHLSAHIFCLDWTVGATENRSR